MDFAAARDKQYHFAFINSDFLVQTSNNNFLWLESLASCSAEIIIFSLVYLAEILENRSLSYTPHPYTRGGFGGGG